MSTAATLVIGALVCLVSCRQVLGVETRTEGDPPLALGEACGACVEATCADAEKTCAADSGCAAAAACMAEAGPDNPIRRAACREEHFKAAATTAFEAMDGCMRADCQTDCYGGTGFFAAYPAKCQLCTEESCGDAPSRCVADADCEALAVKAYGEGPAGHDPEAISALSFALGGTNERELGRCPIDNCPLDCGFDGTNLDCAGYSWPRSLPATAVVELEVRILDLDFNELPVPHAVVDVCDPIGDDCGVSDTFPADASGLATTHVSLDSNAGFRGFFRVRAEDENATLPTHLFVYPITRDSRGLAPVYRASDVSVLLEPGKAHIGGVLFDCSGRQTADVMVTVPSGVDVAPVLGLSPGTFAFINADPGCIDIVGHNSMGETHKTRVQAVADVVTWVYAYPTSAPEALSYTCEP